MQRKLDVAKLQSQRTAEAYSAQLSVKLNQPNSCLDDAGGLWAHISHSMRTAAEEVIGFRRPQPRNQWYDQECRDATAAKYAAYKKTLQSAATRAMRETIAKRERKRDAFSVAKKGSRKGVSVRK